MKGLKGIKLNRKDRVYKKLKELTNAVQFSASDDIENFGFQANTISEQINISRNNVSKELNCLLKEGKTLKVLGKPVLYFDKVWLETRFKVPISELIFNNVFEFKKLFINDLPSNEAEVRTVPSPSEVRGGSGEKHDEGETIFQSIIGGEDGLKTQVKQAKAAILYPPNGLHTLLVGPTGTGKTTFAEIMYRYAKEVCTLKPNAPYVIFNCADYAENAQLLLSHLFGYVKGAFTGANAEKKGLVDQANGGILFLDEVHRLPPEGQEMLFSLLDRSRYRRLGEAENTRKANILFIAATTENPKSVILDTFMRRIPVVITLPSLGERSLKERMTLICEFFREESVKIRIPVRVSKEVLKVLLLYKCPGNIGQLRNDIQLICANAFVEYVTEKRDFVHVKLSQLSQRFKEGMYAFDNKRSELAKDFNLNDFESITFNGLGEGLSDNLKSVLLYDEYKTEEDFYDLILQDAQKFYEDGFSISEIKQNITMQIQNRFENSTSRIKSKKLALDKEVLSKIVTPEIVDIVQDSLTETLGEWRNFIDAKIVYSLSLHIETLVERIRLGYISIHPNVEKIHEEHKKEYEIAKRLLVKLEEKLSIKIPDDEAALIAMLLFSINKKKNNANVQVLVITHGYATATNMVQVVKTLLGYECIYALDMPLEERVQDVLDRATEEVKRINKGKGVLLLVDMGSLTTFPEIITEKTGIPTRVVKMVSTPMVIEAARKAMVPDMDLDTLVEDVKSMSALIGERIKVNDISSNNIDFAKVSYQEGITNLLSEALTFLNVEKATKVLGDVLENILVDCNKSMDDSINIKFLFHCSCMIERAIRNEALSYKKFINVKTTKEKLFICVKSNFKIVEEVFGITIEDSELAYIVQMLDMHFNASVGDVKCEKA
jgi:transcriptional regulator with AAA-type ATPase domain/transcriptional regulatory protein LevR